MHWSRESSLLEKLGYRIVVAGDTYQNEWRISICHDRTTVSWVVMAIGDRGHLWLYFVNGPKLRDHKSRAIAKVKMARISGRGSGQLHIWQGFEMGLNYGPTLESVSVPIEASNSWDSCRMVPTMPDMHLLCHPRLDKSFSMQHHNPGLFWIEFFSKCSSPEKGTNFLHIVS